MEVANDHASKEQRKNDCQKKYRALAKKKTIEMKNRQCECKDSFET